jgi:hypothetical protein
MTIRTSLHLRLLAAVACVLLVSVASFAVSARALPLTAASFQAPVANQDATSLGNDAVIGWQFTTNADISVTRLGYYGHFGHLNNPHDVGIFDNAGTLLGSGIIPSGGGPLTNQFKYVDLASPISLLAHQTFQIGALSLSNSDVFAVRADNNNFTVDPLLTYVRPLWKINVNTLQNPNEIPPGEPSFGTKGLFGPNFQFEATAAVPEPAAAVLLVIGLLVLAGSCWLPRRGKRQQLG